MTNDAGGAKAIDPETYYQKFSVEIGARDWIRANARHEQLKLLVRDVLRGEKDLRILDLGCGTGVMTNYLSRYGEVTGVDFSGPAIEMARRLVPKAEFHAGRLSEVGLTTRFDVVTLFDVLEHVLSGDRASFISAVRDLLCDDGQIIASTPHASYTRWLQREHPELLQVVDEPVALTEVLELADGFDLELVRYYTYDIGHRRQYQLFVLEPAVKAAAQPVLDPRLGIWMGATANPVNLAFRRARLALRMLGRGQFKWAAWLIWPRGDPPYASG